MCLLSVFEPGVPVDIDDIQRGAWHNPDGSGYAIAYNNRMILRRSMNGHKLAEEFERMRTKYPESHALFHSRIGTGGTLDVSNVHPFAIDAKSVIAHNGILWRVPANETRSDTRIFAETKMRTEYRRWQKEAVRRQIEQFIGVGNKMAILSIREDRPSLVILNEREGIWTEEGVWHSNESYQPYISRSWEATYWQRDCLICESIGSIELDVCGVCGSCAVCGSVRCDGRACRACKCPIVGTITNRELLSETIELVEYECPSCSYMWQRILKAPRPVFWAKNEHGHWVQSESELVES